LSDTPPGSVHDRLARATPDADSNSMSTAILRYAFTDEIS